MKHVFWGLVLIAAGALALMQVFGEIHLAGFHFWPVALTLLGLSILGESLHHRVSWFGMALGLWVGGIGLFDILADSGITTIRGNDILHHGWPLLLVALGLRLLFGRHARWHCGHITIER